MQTLLVPAYDMNRNPRTHTRAMQVICTLYCIYTAYHRYQSLLEHICFLSVEILDSNSNNYIIFFNKSLTRIPTLIQDLAASTASMNESAPRRGDLVWLQEPQKRGAKQTKQTKKYKTYKKYLIKLINPPLPHAPFAPSWFPTTCRV